MSKWLYLILIFVLAGLLYPAIYFVGLEELWDGTLLKVPVYIIYSVLMGFFLYPFVEGYRRFNIGDFSFAIMFFITGIILPVISGAFLIILFESMSKSRSRG
ncbi:hypothetical protein ACJJIW_21765 [Microbulbifer sp. JMSA004]|uniref:hypothetical protein n=1 Tax=Microbulbifer sp. JMSA004 TaxID=3243370 RepID=UPI00403A5FE7